MSRHLFTVFVALVIGLSLLLYLFTYQARSNEVVMVLRFGKPVQPLPPAGIHLRWPWPIDEVRRFDNRLHVHDGVFEERLTRDGFNVIAAVCVGWRIAPEGVEQFNKNCGSSTDPIKDAWKKLEGIVRDRVHVALGERYLTDFVSVREDHLQYDAMEREVVESAGREAFNTYGIDVVLLQIRRLELPGSVTAKVYNRMKVERQREAQNIKSDGSKKAAVIRENAKSQRDQIIAMAKAAAEEIKGQGDAEAAQHYARLKENPELAIYLREIRALREAPGKNTTLIVDTNVPPFNRLISGPPDLEKK